MTSGRWSPARWSLATPAKAGAVAILHLAGDIDEALRRLQIKPVPLGAVVLREIPALDTALLARVSAEIAQIMPHGGPAVVRGLIERVQAAGLAPIEEDARVLYPEAADRLEAEMLACLARAASPAAIDLLLAQPSRWRREFPNLCAEDLPPVPATDRDRLLNRVVEPPLVVAWGPPNIGKSTLCNTLARREVALVADAPGSTRDHVGVMIEVRGLTIRYADTPGVRPPADLVEAQAATRALALAQIADLILLCGDPTSPPPPPPHTSVPTLSVCLRADLGKPAWPAAITVSAARDEGVEALAASIAELLVPNRLLDDGKPWRFWP